MPILGAIVLLIQFCFAYHALKTGRPKRFASTIEDEQRWVAAAQQAIRGA